jgi:type I restriction enzyme S subunit
MSTNFQARISDVCQLGDGAHASVTRALAGVPYLTSKNIGQGELKLDQMDFISEEDYNRLFPPVSKAITRLRAGDVLTGIIGTFSNSYVYKASDSFGISSAIAILRPDPSRLLPQYLYYHLNTPYLQSLKESVASGSVQGYTNLTVLGSLPIRLPSLGDQRAIAEVLGALDDKIAGNTKLAATASGLAGLNYERSAADFDVRPMSDLLTPVLGGTPARSRADFWGGEQPWASAKDITGAQFGVVLSTDEKITGAAIADTKAKPLPAGSVILTARGTVGAVARLAAPASFNQSCYGFVPGAIPPGVLYFAITSAMLRAKEIAHGSVFDTITMKTFDHLPFPDFDAEALAATEGEIGPLLETVVAMVQENSSLAATRDALLPQLMSGKLRVREAEKVLENAGV